MRKQTKHHRERFPKKCYDNFKRAFPPVVVRSPLFKYEHLIDEASYSRMVRDALVYTKAVERW